MQSKKELKWQIQEVKISAKTGANAVANTGANAAANTAANTADNTAASAAENSTPNTGARLLLTVLLALWA